MLLNYLRHKILTPYIALFIVSILNSKEKEGYVSNELFICFDGNSLQSEIQNIIKKYELSEKRRFKLTKSILHSLPDGVDAAIVKKDLSQLNEVVYSDFNNTGYNIQNYVSNEPHRNQQWALSNSGQLANGIQGIAGVDIQWDEAMKLYEPKENIIVAVIDSGVAIDHPEIGSRLGGMIAEINGVENYDDDGNGLIDDKIGWDFIDWDNLPSDLNGHGTNVSGIIAGTPDNEIGITGVAPNAYIMPLRVFNEYGGGATDERIILALDYAIEAGARIINLSLGKGQPFSIPLQEAIYQLDADYDTLLVCAAGNGGDDGIGDNVDLAPFYPACYDGKAILSVGACNQNNELAPFSNFGLQNVDIVAPGTNILVPDVSRGVLYSENFETFNPNWRYFSALGNQSNYQWNYFQDGSGNHWVTDSDYDTQFNLLYYQPYTNTFLSSPYYDLSGFSSPKLNVRVYHDLRYNYSLRSYDYLFFEVSDDFGISWKTIGYTYGQSYSLGSLYSFDISEYEGENIQIRFRLWSDGLLQGDGVYIDDLEITGVTSFSYTGEEYEYVNGTSFSTPIVSGVAALILSQRPELTAQEVREILLQSVTKVDGFSSKVVSGGIVNAEEALKLANDWDVGEWILSSWFGYFYDIRENWIYHWEIGWLYHSPSDIGSWFWNDSLGWLWTSSDAFPFFYSNSEESWMYYKNHENIPIFWNYSTSEWIHI